MSDVRERVKRTLDQAEEHIRDRSFSYASAAIANARALLALIDSGEPERIGEAFNEVGIGGIYDVFDADNPADAIRQLGQYIQEAEEALPGGFMPGKHSPHYGNSLADRIRELREPEPTTGRDEAIRQINEGYDEPDARYVVVKENDAVVGEELMSSDDAAQVVRYHKQMGAKSPFGLGVLRTLPVGPEPRVGPEILAWAVFVWSSDGEAFGHYARVFETSAAAEEHKSLLDEEGGRPSVTVETVVRYPEPVGRAPNGGRP